MLGVPCHPGAVVARVTQRDEEIIIAILAYSDHRPDAAVDHALTDVKCARLCTGRSLIWATRSWVDESTHWTLL